MDSCPLPAELGGTVKVNVPLKSPLGKTLERGNREMMPKLRNKIRPKVTGPGHMAPLSGVSRGWLLRSRWLTHDDAPGCLECGFLCVPEDFRDTFRCFQLELTRSCFSEVTPSSFLGSFECGLCSCLVLAKLLLPCLQFLDTPKSDLQCPNPQGGCTRILFTALCLQHNPISSRTKGGGGAREEEETHQNLRLHFRSSALQGLSIGTPNGSKGTSWHIRTNGRPEGAGRRFVLLFVLPFFAFCFSKGHGFR